jgi:membrane-associated phospholipid phosphatase
VTTVWTSHRANAIGLVVSLGVLVLAGAAAAGGLTAGEETIFVAVNSAPDAFYYAIWPFMQYGVFLTIPVLTVAALVARRARLAVTMAMAGVGVYLLARVVKELVDRERPGALIGAVEARETFQPGSLGFPSGHVAVAAALAVVVTPHLRGRWRLVPAALAVIVCIGRMYVGAHVPLDLVGGAALGVAAGCAANLVMSGSSPPRLRGRQGVEHAR